MVRTEPIFFLITEGNARKKLAVNFTDLVRLTSQKRAILVLSFRGDLKLYGASSTKVYTKTVDSVEDAL